ncbi:uncharacterized protein LY79DRAFT_635603 [Colletotrichum navitas]|uniref:Uncharacterized protein n=1 Tax=Colletotrichum navitas TaxID=681940 RepID=A0AAD8V1B2_9PEZI|nr:uncharacterized protein LY79DRAFT_635603 [Colletotrichum navitas]KAK1585126.1 hypothetical protein LY79DRAFT_635603 [Colletotrichum navitas]
MLPPASFAYCGLQGAAPVKSLAFCSPEAILSHLQAWTQNISGRVMVGSRDTHNYQPVHPLECGSEGFEIRLTASQLGPRHDRIGCLPSMQPDHVASLRCLDGGVGQNAGAIRISRLSPLILSFIP